MHKDENFQMSKIGGQTYNITFSYLENNKTSTMSQTPKNRGIALASKLTHVTIGLKIWKKLIQGFIFDFPRVVHFEFIVEFVIIPLEINAALASKNCSFNQRTGNMVDVRPLELQNS